MSPFIRTVTGDINQVTGSVYCHEHLIIDSALIEAKFPHIHLYDVEAAVREVSHCLDEGVGLMVDCMPCSAGRDVVKLNAISRVSGMAVVAATGLHHDRYYGHSHWTNHVSAEALTDLFVEDLTNGVDAFDYTGPIVQRTSIRAGILKVATASANLDARDRRNLDAVAEASVRTGAPIITHCEDGRGGLEQIQRLTAAGVPAGSIILSHVDKLDDLGYLDTLASSGAVLEFDQLLRQYGAGADGSSLKNLCALVAKGLSSHLVLGTDGARRSLWSALGGEPGLSWLGRMAPVLLRERGIADDTIGAIVRDNAVRSLSWRAVSATTHSSARQREFSEGRHL